MNKKKKDHSRVQHILKENSKETKYMGIKTWNSWSFEYNT